MAETSQNLIHSLYKDQPIYRELLASFVACIPERLNKANAAFEERNWLDLSKVMHQLRGAAASYGYPSLAAEAAHIELASQAPNIQEERIGDSLSHIASTCRRIELGLKALEAEDTL